ncbi:MAG: redoxin domain-containing protein [Nitrospirae bacterium]|nr:redoxin domain-containing protein [Nitrospirota bacterium]
MTIVLKNIFIIIALVLFPFLGGCTEDKAPELSGNKMSVAELLASMDMRHMAQPVKAPDFELPSVGGGTVGISQHRGKVVLLSFWTTW